VLAGTVAWLAVVENARESEIFSLASTIPNSIGKLVGMAASIVGFASEILATRQGIPPSKLMRARILAAVLATRLTRFGCKMPNEEGS
jgi:hypothetical protein